MVFVKVVDRKGHPIANRNDTSPCLAAVSVAIMGLLDRCCYHEAEWQESSGQWHFIGPSAKCTDLLNKEEGWARRGVDSPAPSSYVQTATLNGAIGILHNLVLLGNHRVPLVMVSNASRMRRSGIVLCSVDGIRRNGRQGEAAL